MSSEQTRRRFQLGLLTAMGLPAAALDQPGTSIASAEDRRGQGSFSCYSLGSHRVLWCDPLIAEQLADVTEVAFGDAAILELATERGWEILGSAVMKTFVAPFQPARAVCSELKQSGHRTHSFDWSEEEDVALVQGLIDASSRDDLDYADLELGDLDDLAVGIVDGRGALVAYASMRPWTHQEGFGDIAVLTRRDVRRKGLGRAAVSALIERRLPPEWDPLYRCDTDNLASAGLSERLGFEVATSLIAIQVIQPTASPPMRA